MCVVADRAVVGAQAIDIGGDEAAQLRDELRAVAVYRHEVGFVCREVVVAQHLTSARLIEDGDLYTIAEGRLAID